jgi:dolichol-phosphate mannosyltransferase
LFSFSLVPLRLGIAAGCFFLVIALAEMLLVSLLWLVPGPHKLVPGWSSLILMVTIGDGVIMTLLGFIGIYVGMIFQEVKRRPVYVIHSARSRFRRAGEDRSAR